MKPHADYVTVSDDTLRVELSDGRTISVPLAWYPRLVHATQDERNNWELIGNGQGIRWPDLDEDLSVEGFIAGRQSRESQRSLKRWLEARLAGRNVLLYDLNHGELMSDGEPPRTTAGRQSPATPPCAWPSSSAPARSSG